MSVELKVNAPLYIQLKERIMEQFISPGKEWLPTEAQLMKMFHVSRVTVRKAVEELTKENLVQKIQGQGTRVIQKKISNILVVCNSRLEAYHHDLIDGLMEIMPDHRVNFSLVKIDDDPKSIEHIKACSYEFDGILRCGYLRNEYAAELELEDILAKAVFLHPCDPIENTPCVLLDRASAFESLTRHLLELGHKKIAFIGYADAGRTGVISSVMYKHGLELPEELCINIHHSRKGGYDAAQELLSKSTDFTAVMCGNDITAYGAMQYFLQHGISIPEDISLTGYDNLRESASYPVPLTTAGVDMELQINSALQLLDNRSSEHIMLETSMKVRSSTGLVKKKSV